MCRRVQCDRCARPTFAGCGAHVEQVLRDVPPEARCRCHERAAKESDGGARPGWLRNLFGKLE